MHRETRRLETSQSPRARRRFCRLPQTDCFHPDHLSRTSSSAIVGCNAIVSSKCCLVAPARMATAAICRISGASGPSQIGRAQSELQSLMRISYAVFCLKKKQPSPHTDTFQQHYLTQKCNYHIVPLIPLQNHIDH